MSTQLPNDPSNYYVWRASEGFAIQLSLNAVTQINALIQRMGNQAAGMRGILLGRTVDTPLRATIVEDFKVVVPIDDQPISPEAADALLEIASRTADSGPEQKVIGFYTVEREGRLNLRTRDMDTFSRLFCETGKVALIIQSSRRGNESDAALFYWQHGGAYPRDFGFGFPLEATQLAEGHPGWRYPDPLEDMHLVAAPAPASTPAAAPVATATTATTASASAKSPLPRTVPPVPPGPRVSGLRREGIRWSHLLPTAALVVIGICAIQIATSPKHAVAASQSQVAGANQSEASFGPAPTNTPGVLGLTVTARPRQLEVRWNSESPSIKESERGVMKITEAGVTQVIPISERELRDGYVSYTPTTNDVRIAFDVTSQGGKTVTESIRAVAIP
jgi:hypothetical protein